MTEDKSAKRVFIVVFIVVIIASAGLLLVFGPMLFNTGQVGDKTYNYTWTVEPDTHEWAKWELAAGLGIYGNYTVTGGSLTDIVFFICDESNYNSFNDDGEAPTKYNEIYAPNGAFTFVIPTQGFWYWVLFNNKSTTMTVNFIFAQDATAPLIDYNLIPLEQYAGIYEVTATITDTFDISMVEFFVDDDLVVTQSGKNFAYSWNTTLWTNGDHDITFTAQDNVGNKRTVTFQVELVNTG